MEEKFEIVPININADIHNHTKGSDGTQSSFRFLLRASHNGKNIISMSDHDSVEGYKNLEEDLYSVVETIKDDKSYSPERIKKLVDILENIKILKGTELITSYNGVIIEVLGYNFDVNKMRQEIQNLKSTVKQKPYEALYEGFSKIIDEKRLAFDKSVLDEAYNKIKIEGKGGVVGPFFNELYAHEENRSLLKYIDENGQEQEADTLKLFINKHLYNKKSELFVDMSKTRPSYKDTIDAIHRAGGITSLAHPGRYEDKFDVLSNLDDMIELGLDSVEVFYPDHPYEYREKLLEKVRNHGIKASGGSDDHHKQKEGIQYQMERIAIPNVPEVKWMEESVETGLDFVRNSDSIKEMIERLRRLQKEREEKIKLRDKLKEQNKSKEETKEK